MLDKEGKKIDAVVIGTPDHITFPDESGVEQKEPLGTRGKIGKVFMEEKFSISYNQADPRDPRGWTASEFNSKLGLTCE